MIKYSGKYFCHNMFFQILEEKVEQWMNKYDSDVEQKQHELDVLKVMQLGIFVLSVMQFCIPI